MKRRDLVKCCQKLASSWNATMETTPSIKSQAAAPSKSRDTGN